MLLAPWLEPMHMNRTCAQLQKLHHVPHAKKWHKLENTPAIWTLIKHSLSFIGGPELLGVKVHASMLAFYALHMVILHSDPPSSRSYSTTRPVAHDSNCCVIITAWQYCQWLAFKPSLANLRCDPENLAAMDISGNSLQCLLHRQQVAGC